MVVGCRLLPQDKMCREEGAHRYGYMDGGELLRAMRDYTTEHLLFSATSLMAVLAAKNAFPDVVRCYFVGSGGYYGFWGIAFVAV